MLRPAPIVALALLAAAPCCGGKAVVDVPAGISDGGGGAAPQSPLERGCAAVCARKVELGCHPESWDCTGACVEEPTSCHAEYETWMICSGEQADSITACIGDFAEAQPCFFLHCDYRACIGDPHLPMACR